MVFVSRRIAYPFFTAIILLVFFALLFLGFFSTSLVANITDSSVSIVGSQIVIKIPLENKSNHIIDNISVTIASDKSSQVLPIKGDYAASKLLPNEKYEFLATIPIGESYDYTATVTAPFNRPIVINIPLDPATVDPVKAELSIQKSMVIGREYSYSVKLCNVSPSDLSEVFWAENAKSGDFKESFWERSVSLNKSECKTIYSTLTPIRTGEISMSFSLTIGALKKEVTTVINVTDPGPPAA